MEYKGFVIDHCDVYSVEDGWHKFGVIINVGTEHDYTCTGKDIVELENNFKQLVDLKFDELDKLTSVIDLELDEWLMNMIQNDSNGEQSTKEIVTRMIYDGYEIDKQ